MRRLRNVSDTGMRFPELGILIPPGGEADVDLPDGQPVPFGLEEVIAAPPTVPGKTKTPTLTPIAEVSAPTSTEG